MTQTETALRAALQWFGRTGSLRLTLSDGSVHQLGDGPPHGDLRLVTPDAAGRLLRGGTLGFAEAYLDDLVDSEDLRAFLLWGAANQERWVAANSRMVGPIRRLWQRNTRTTRHTQVETMVDHYNLGNDFYSAWLDDTMTYSSARFPEPGTDLAAAQRHKYTTIANHAGIQPGMRVLEIGCGWGGFAEFAARELGAHVTSLTVADEQARFARKRVADAGLTGMVDIRLEDFRDTTGQFDAVVSIEMIESVDERTWPSLFDAFCRRLRPGGRTAMQSITIRDDLFDTYRRRQDFIQRYVFPGGQLPSPGIITALAGHSGLSVAAREQFGLDYARTLSLWADRFERAWTDLTFDDPRLDERFRRMWRLYLAYCEAGFRAGTIDVEQWAFERT